MAQLPLVIKRDIRDKFDAADDSVQKEVLKLKITLGFPTHLDVSWSSLWTECGRHFIDKAAFVPYIISYVDTLLSALSQKLDEDTSPWADKFLELLTPNQELRLNLQSCEQNETSLTWFDAAGLTLYIPLNPATTPTPSVQLMLEHLEGLFADSSMLQESRPSTSSSMDGIKTPMSSLTFSSDFSFPTTNPTLVAEASPLPRLESLPRPGELFSRSKLHIIHMRFERDRQRLIQIPANASVQYLPDRITIQSMHEPSLKLIHDYFTKWTRPDPQTREKIPLLRHILCPSTIGHGSHDTLVAEPFSEVSARSGSMLNPALYQCFIEGVLGFEVVHRSTSEGHKGTSWEFRRSRPFA